MNPAWLAYLQLMRAPAVLTAISNIVAAHLVATGGVIEWGPLTALLLASCALLAAGMVLNDCFDRYVDARIHPKRPLPSGAVPASTAWRLGFSLLVTGVVLAGFASRQSLVIAAALAATILAYDGSLKNTSSGPLVMGLCRYMNWLLGLSVTTLTVSHWILPLPVFVYAAVVSVYGRLEPGMPDKRLIVIVASGLVIVGLSIFALWRDEVLAGAAVVPLTVAALAAGLYVVARSYREGSAGSVGRAVELMMLGTIGLDALLVLGRGIWLGSGLVVLIPAAKWLGRRVHAR